MIDEGALRRLIGEPGVMHRQLQHLLSVAEQPHVTLRVVPLAAGAHAATTELIAQIAAELG